MKAIAWDDKPEEYFYNLKRYLMSHKIEMTILTDENELIDKLSTSPDDWDLIITDLLDERTPDGSQDLEAGERIASYDTGGKPVYVVTNNFKLTDGMKLPASVQVKSKRTPAAYVAAEIRRDLEQRGLFVDKTTVALIYGHDLDARLSLEEFLTKRHPNGCGLKVDILDPARFGGNLLSDLHAILSKSGAVIALCTPDDCVKMSDAGREFFDQPRQNVLMEIGMVLGAPNGAKRLITVQKWGETVKEQAKLPSDLGGWLNVRYQDKIHTSFPKIREKLQRLGMRMSCE